MVICSDTKDLRPVATGQHLLHELFNQILADEDDLYITLADVSSPPSTEADRNDDEPQVQVTDANLRSFEMEIDAQADVNQPNTAES